MKEPHIGDTADHPARKVGDQVGQLSASSGDKGLVPFITGPVQSGGNHADTYQRPPAVTPSFHGVCRPDNQSAQYAVGDGMHQFVRIGKAGYAIEGRIRGLHKNNGAVNNDRQPVADENMHIDVFEGRRVVPAAILMC